jgi:CrcB protein
MVQFPPLVQIAAVGFGGAVGSVARFLCSFSCAQLFGTDFPWGTLVVNLFGSLWLGFIGGLAAEKPGLIDPVVRLLLTSGFAGGLTTFSTFTFETLALYQRGEFSIMWGNVIGNIVLGFGAAVIGIWLSRINWGVQ